VVRSFETLLIGCDAVLSDFVGKKRKFRYCVGSEVNKNRFVPADVAEACAVYFDAPAGFILN